MIVPRKRASHAHLLVFVRPLQSTKWGEAVHQQQYVKSTAMESAMGWTKMTRKLAQKSKNDSATRSARKEFFSSCVSVLSGITNRTCQVRILEHPGLPSRSTSVSIDSAGRASCRAIFAFLSALPSHFCPSTRICVAGLSVSPHGALQLLLDKNKI
jgi:hypothetical protein